MSFCLICRNGTDLQINERLKKISLIYRNVDMQMEGFVYHLNASLSSSDTKLQINGQRPFVMPVG